MNDLIRSFISDTIIVNVAFPFKANGCTPRESTLTRLYLPPQRGTTLVCLCCSFKFSQPTGVMSSVFSLPNHTFTGQALSSKRLTSILCIENISLSISTKECCQPCGVKHL